MDREFPPNYRDELKVTGLVMIIMVFGSFFIADRLTALQSKKNNDGEGRVEVTPTGSSVLGEKIDRAIETALEISPTEIPTLPTVGVTVTPGPLETEVFYGIGGQYQKSGYEMTLNSPRLRFNMNKSESRLFVVDVAIKNLKVVDGLTNKITATIVKDGVVIVPKAALSLSESKRIGMGETLTFQARISLIEGTDVKDLLYEPEGVGENVIHELQPKPE